MQPHHFSSQTAGMPNNSIQKELSKLRKENEMLLKGLVRWKCRYRSVKRFLMDKGVPKEYFDEYNSRFDEGESKSRV